MENITVTLNAKDKKTGEQKQLIKEMFATCKGGEVTALMGPSGAGKTTLLNAISGMAPYAHVDGSVSLGGKQLSKDLLSYVAQFDHLVEGFTVMETLLSAAMLKVNTTQAEAEKEIITLAGLLGFGGVINHRIYQLAQGQKKLVSVARGLVTKPKVIFLDEPTTGLDSTAAHFVAEHIVNVARSGVTVIMTLHQPSSEVFEMLDSILLLDAHGNLAYSGKITGAEQYFAAMSFPTQHGQNAADIFLDALAKEPYANHDDGQARLQELEHATDKSSWAAVYESSNSKKTAYESMLVSKDAAPMVFEPPAHPGELSRLVQLIKRFTVQYWRIPGAYIYRLVTIIIFGFFAGSLYNDIKPETAAMTEITGCIFFGLWCSLYLTLGNIPTFLEDRYDCVNGYAAGRYTFGTWCIAQFIAAIPWQLMCATCFTTVVYWIPFYNWQISEDPESYIYGILVSFLMMITFEGVNWMMIELLRSDMLAVTASMTMLGTFFMFAGFFIKIKDIPWGVRWMAYCVPTKYVFPGHIFNFFDGQDFELPDGSKVRGATLADELLNIDYGRIENHGDDDDNTIYGPWRKWMDLLIGLAFVINYRSTHHMLLGKMNGELGEGLPEANETGASWSGPSKPVRMASDVIREGDDTGRLGKPRVEQMQMAAPGDESYLSIAGDDSTFGSPTTVVNVHKITNV